MRAASLEPLRSERPELQRASPRDEFSKTDQPRSLPEVELPRPELPPAPVEAGRSVVEDCSRLFPGSSRQEDAKLGCSSQTHDMDAQVSAADETQKIAMEDTLGSSCLHMGDTTLALDALGDTMSDDEDDESCGDDAGGDEGLDDMADELAGADEAEEAEIEQEDEEDEGEEQGEREEGSKTEGEDAAQDESDSSESDDGDDVDPTVSDGGREEAAKEIPTFVAPEISKVEPAVDDMTSNLPAVIEALIKKKKRKKKKQKIKKKKTVAEDPPKREKRPPVPRFAHPVGWAAKLDAEQGMVVQSTAVVANERHLIPMRERFSKELLHGRFPKRKPVAVDAGAGAGEADEEGHDEDVQGPMKSVKDVLKHARRSRPLILRARSVESKPADGESKSVEANLGSTTASSSSRPPRLPRSTGKGDGDLGGLAIVGTRSQSRSQSCAPKLKAPKNEDKYSCDPGLNSLYYSFSSMRGPDGQKIPLQNRDKVLQTLHELNSKVALPMCRHFGLRYNFFSEHHCQAKKAGVTVKDPLILRKKGPDGEEVQETRHLVTIRLRVRVHPTRGDPQNDFISKGTQLAVLLHELCHLKHMNHGKDFMLFLRDVFAHACKLGVFDPAALQNDIPSPWPWENEIFRTGGAVDDETLLCMFAEHRAAQRAKEDRPPEEPPVDEKQQDSPAPEPIAPKSDEDGKITEHGDGEQSESVSTAASESSPSTTLRETSVPDGARRKGKGKLGLVSAFRGNATCAESCECCEPEAEGFSNFEMAYGEDDDARSALDGQVASQCLKLPKIPGLPVFSHAEVSAGPLQRISSVPSLPLIA
eukprot:TRINITY_DN19979_c0_g1_i1.p1 TRINITY_DN19979_c0_g1~~TRINITY_DN19979_c0_g1_i1.p1  ORF type:complete len:952 (+),score=219.28 TRINITY_DN19979_c0_g1_i1:410-2857(+)